MSNAPQLQPVLTASNADFDNSLERLFALLRIKSISADPAFAGIARRAADHLQGYPSLGFATEVRPTAGHPAIVAKPNGGAKGNGRAPIVLCHYDVQPVDRSIFGTGRPFEPAVTDQPTGEKSSSRAVPRTTRGS